LHEAFVKSLRARSDIVVAAGSCANFGAKNQFQKQASSGAIDISDVVETAIDKIIPVDHSVYGCPITPQELSKVVKAIIMGATPFIPNYPVCSECKMQALECMFDKGHACYGPVTRAGCNAICLQNDISCDGCRGTIPAANTKQLSTIISQRNLRLHNTDKRFGLFGMELENINA
jgi:coenzyme F420-reducing hydrogenase gamma subunit